MNTDQLSMNSLTSMGIVNALRTGSPQVDMAIAVCLPFALNFLVTNAKNASDWILLESFLSGYFRTNGITKQYEHRTITYKSTYDEYGDVLTDRETYNSALFKAIRLYLHNVIKLKLKDADLDLTQNEDKSSTNHDKILNSFQSSKNTHADTMSTYDVLASPPKNEFHEIGKFGDSMTTIELKIAEQEHQTEGSNTGNGGGSKKNSKSTVVQYHFRSEDGLAIDDFIDKAYNYYIGVLRSNEDNSRHMYELKVIEQENRPHVFKRYRLSEEKTFASLFFRQKDSLLTLIDDFMDRSGRYSIPGYPLKLGLLLHGPPGTGKTSLIKSLAQYTGRSIVNVPLSRITTNSELMSIFYDNKKRVDGQHAPANLGFRDVIYVMEDVDAASKVVKRRDGLNTTISLEGSKNHPIVHGKSIFQMFLESMNGNCKQLVAELVEKSDRLKQELQKAGAYKSVTRKLTRLSGLGCVGETGDNPHLKNLAKDAVAEAKKQAREQQEVDTILGDHAKTLLNIIGSLDKIDAEFEEELLGSAPLLLAPPVPVVEQKNDSDSDSSLGSFFDPTDGFGNEGKSGDKNRKDSPWGNSSRKKGTGFGFSSFFKPPPDALNLQGILNVLDGVVDSPGRIVVMTTNHPEQLDPALIRPGRVDKKLFMGYMEATDVVLMLQHYYQTILSPEERKRIGCALSEKDCLAQSCLCLTPAQVEQMTAEFDDVTDLIDALEEKVRSINTPPPKKKRRIGC